MSLLPVASVAGMTTFENLSTTLSHSVFTSALGTDSFVSFDIALAEFTFALILLLLVLCTSHTDVVRLYLAALAEVDRALVAPNSMLTHVLSSRL